MEKRKNGKKVKKGIAGITLVALVVTIVVLIILAGVSISMISGENGILTQAQNAKDETELASIREELQIMWIEVQTETANKNLSKDEIAKYFEDKIKEKDPDATVKYNKQKNIYEISYKDHLFEIKAGNLTMDREEALDDVTNAWENVDKDIPKEEQADKIEEELQEAETERQELYSLNNSYNIVKECIERAYRQVKENISPKFMTNLCDIISKISNKRYTNIVLNDDEGLNVEIKNGNYVPVSRLSVGTVDQMYISLRLSALREVSTERMPIILDEAFAYFDEDRLENKLKYISSSFKKNQIIIFTCSQREENSLKRLGIEYNMIKI